jgi:hypothetical protein
MAPRLTCVPGVDWSVVALGERGARRAKRWCRRTSTDAFPNINASSFRVPDAALREQIPVDVELPDTRCIADDGRHVRTIVRGSQFERGDGDGENGG